MKTAVFPAIVLLLSLLFSAPALLHADYPLSLSSPVPLSEARKPGSVVVHPVMIDYQGTDPTGFTVSLTLPEGWRPLGGAQTIGFAAAGSELVLAGFHIPSRAAAGNYTAVVRVGSPDGGGVEMTIPIEVLPVPGLSCTVTRQPDYILAGAAYQVLFACGNSGNIPLTIDAKATSSQGFDIRIESSRFALLPGETANLTVLVDTPVNLTRMVRHILQLQLKVSDHDGVKAAATSMLDIIPRVTGMESRYNTIEGEVKTAGVLQHGELDLFGLEGELTGEGFLDGEGSTRLFYRLRRPLAGAGTLVPDRKDYYLNLAGPDYSAAFGTQYVSLSPLTSSSGYGAGISLSRRFGDLEVRGFSLETLPAGSSESSSGGKISYRFGDRGSASFNIFDTAGETSWTSGSIEGHFLTAEGGRLEMEYASSDGTRPDQAFYTSFGWGSDRFSFFTRYLEAGPWYLGPLEDRRDFISTCSYAPLDTFRIQGSVGRRSWDLNQAIPSTLDTTRIGLFWAPVSGTMVTASLQNGTESGLQEELLRFGLSRSNGAIDLGLSWDLGSRLDFVEGARAYSQRLTTKLDARTDELGAFSATLGYLFRDYEAEKPAAPSITLSWKNGLTPRTDFLLEYRSTDPVSSYYEGDDSLTLRLDHTFPGRSMLTVATEYGPDRRSGSPDDVTVTIAFSTAFSIPVTPKKNIGVVEGKVIDAATGSALPNVVLRMGDAIAASDTFGRFRFHNLHAGEHRLYIDPASLPQGYLPAERMPLSITVGKQTAEKEIRIVQAAGLSGQILVYSFDRNYQWIGQADGETSPYSEPAGASGVLLTLEGPDGTVRRALSGENGAFAFPPLVPGSWTLTIPDDAVPEGHFVAKGDYRFDLLPGEKQETNIRLFPRTRTIKFIDEGTLEESVPEEEEEP